MNEDIDPRESCEWFEQQKARVGNRIVAVFCSHPDNKGMACNQDNCPIIEDKED